MLPILRKTNPIRVSKQSIYTKSDLCYIPRAPSPSICSRERTDFTILRAIREAILVKKKINFIELMPEQAQNPKSFYTHQKRSSFADRAFVSDYKGRE